MPSRVLHVFRSSLSKWNAQMIKFFICSDLLRCPVENNTRVKKLIPSIVSLYGPIVPYLPVCTLPVWPHSRACSILKTKIQTLEIRDYQLLGIVQYSCIVCCRGCMNVGTLGPMNGVHSGNYSHIISAQCMCYRKFSTPQRIYLASL